MILKRLQVWTDSCYNKLSMCISMAWLTLSQGQLLLTRNELYDFNLIIDDNNTGIVFLNSNSHTIQGNKQWTNLMGKMFTVSCLDHEVSSYKKTLVKIYLLLRKNIQAERCRLEALQKTSTWHMRSKPSRIIENI